MTEQDIRLLQAVFRAAREVAPDATGAGDNRLERALDDFDLRATFTVPA